MGNPKDIEKYNIYEVDGIKVYIQGGLSIPKNEIKITLGKVLFMKAINVDGIYI